jgi:hypothetical protein
MHIFFTPYVAIFARIYTYMDSTPIDSLNVRNDLSSVVASVFSATNIQLSVMMFFVFIMLTSELFITQVLSRFSGTLAGDSPTIKGRCILAMFQTIAYILLDVMLRYDLI